MGKETMINWEYLASLDFSIVWGYSEVLFEGLLVSLGLTAVSVLIGLMGGIILAIGNQSKFKPLGWLVVAYVEVWRNTPLIVQLIWIHFALPVFTGINTTAFQSGLMTLTLGVTAYFTEIVRAGIGSIHKGQWEAADALGLSTLAKWRRIILPQAIRVVLPPLTSLVIGVFKATAILSVLSVNELMQIGNKISNFTYRPVEIITTVAIIYFVTGTVMSKIGNIIENRYTLRN